ncbi:Sugar phosphatase YidA [Poriferisphaera corsica]|uniref:Sugar phosphatase YidA n=1 Tax=Poriferisphaera corsica TaxID=2528020 RepID=A0A517YX01_9BACT|nr:Cof-type HAD-IIB family hydrolase [Poriferisphaera corsica]QDU34739.1 Sugar phosphatase YidA [Poriferisphaera corsica]
MPTTPNSPIIKMIATDLDGTLLRDDKTISPENIAAIQQAVSQGIIVVIASARPPRGVRSYYETLNLDTIQINYNGAAHYDMIRQQFTKHLPLNPQFTRAIVDLAREVDPDVCVSLEVQDKWYTDRVDENLLVETAKQFGPDLVAHLDEIFHEPVTKLMLLAPPDRLKPIHTQVRETFGNQIAIHQSDDHLIQIVDPAVDKEHAVREVAEYYNIARENVMCIGDAQNDEGMIRWAGLGIAVENAWPDTKAIADQIVPSNQNHGVAHAIQKYALQHQAPPCI